MLTSSERMKARRQCNDIFKVLKAKLSMKEKLLFKNEDDVKTFSDKQKLGEYLASRPVLQEILNSFKLKEVTQTGKSIA